MGAAACGQPSSLAEVSQPGGFAGDENYLSWVLQELGDVPEMRCDDGKEIVRRWQGRVIEDADIPSDRKEQSLLECDEPAIGNGRGLGCVPHSRIVKKQLSHLGGPVLWVAICTKDWNTWKVHDRYHVVNLIGYHTVSGATAFFARLADSNPDNQDVESIGYLPGTRIDGTNREAFMDKLGKGGAGVIDQCVNCHNGGPFRRSNMIRVLDEDPGEAWIPVSTWAFAKNYFPYEPYRDPNETFVNRWPPSRIRKTRARACNTCHIINGGGEDAAQLFLHAWDVNSFFPGGGFHLKTLPGGPYDSLEAMKAATDASGNSYGEAFDFILACFDTPESDDCWERNWYASRVPAQDCSN